MYMKERIIYMSGYKLKGKETEIQPGHEPEIQLELNCVYICSNARATVAQW